MLGRGVVIELGIFLLEARDVVDDISLGLLLLLVVRLRLTVLFLPLLEFLFLRLYFLLEIPELRAVGVHFGIRPVGLLLHPLDALLRFALDFLTSRPARPL